jgi:GNAT superfamily N-acetyltransferase
MQRAMAEIHLSFETLSGPALRPLLPALADLRIAVFREWPYLYEGDAAHEQAYLASYADSPGAAVVVCRSAGEVVGAATCQPMVQSHAEVPAAFRAAGLDPNRFCYFGESVLLKPYRGHGAGVRFFTEREAHARALGLPEAAFCAVIRDPDDPRRPSDYTPLDGFWRRRGYLKRPDLIVRFDWKEAGQDAKSLHDLMFWTRTL